MMLTSWISWWNRRNLPRRRSEESIIVACIFKLLPCRTCTVHTPFITSILYYSTSILQYCSKCITNIYCIFFTHVYIRIMFKLWCGYQNSSKRCLSNRKPGHHYKVLWATTAVVEPPKIHLKTWKNSENFWFGEPCWRSTFVIHLQLFPFTDDPA